MDNIFNKRSAGCVLYEMITGKRLFEKPLEITQEIKKLKNKKINKI